MATLLLAAPAAQAVFVATAEDPVGDSTDPNPARDIVAAGFSYDPHRGELRSAIGLRAAPLSGEHSFISLFAGSRTASGCNGFPAAGFGSYSNEFGASWLRLDDPTTRVSGEARKTGFSASVQQFEITSRQLVGLKLDCAYAMLSEPGNSANVYDMVGPIPMVGQPVLSLRIGGAQGTLRIGRPHKLRLVVSNTGSGPTGRVRLTIGRARGLAVKPRARAMASIRPGGRRTMTIVATPTRRAGSMIDLKATARAGRLSATREASLRVHKPARRNGGSGDRGGSGNRTPGLCTRFQPDLSGTTGGSLILVPC